MGSRRTEWCASLNKIVGGILLGGLLAAGCGGGAVREDIREDEGALVDSAATPAVEGQPGWEFNRSFTIDLDADGVDERVVMIANVSMMEGRPLWEDAHIWQVYIEERDATRTYVYARLVPFGHIDILVSPADEGIAPRLILVERMQQKLGVHRILYGGSEAVDVEVLLEEPIDARSGILGSQF